MKYTNQKVKEKNDLIGIIFLVFGILTVLTVMAIFPSESSWSFSHSIFGCIISLIVFSKFTKNCNYLKRVHKGYS